jgi:uncharacterized membrane protein YagU involved in acid resistance
MGRTHSELLSTIGAGLAAGLAGTGVMMAVRSFDQQYAPQTVARPAVDPALAIVKAAELSTGMSRFVPEPVERSAAQAAHIGYGTLFGLLYALLRGRHHARSALADGMLLGAAVYALGYLGWLPAAGLAKPIWKQRYPQIAGELLRHSVYGVATAAVYGLMDR